MIAQLIKMGFHIVYVIGCDLVKISVSVSHLTASQKALEHKHLLIFKHCMIHSGLESFPGLTAIYMGASILRVPSGGI